MHDDFEEEYQARLVGALDGSTDKKAASLTHLLLGTIGWCLLPLAIWLGSDADRMDGEQREVASWEQTPAEITSSTVRAVAIQSDQPGQTLGDDYCPVFHYRYEVDGKSHTGSRYSPTQHPCFGQRGPAEEFVTQWPVGKAITIVTDPGDPSQSYMTAKDDAGYRFGMRAVSLTLYMVSLGSLLFIVLNKLRFRWRRDPERAAKRVREELGQEWLDMGMAPPNMVVPEVE